MTTGPTPVLVGCAHGTGDPAGRRTVADVLLAVGERRPEIPVEPAFVDVQAPSVADVVARCAAQGRPCVVVPLLLSAGYHVHVDVAAAVRGVPSAAAAAPLGPDPRLADLLAERLAQAGARSGDGVVLASAGSSDARAAAATQEAAALLRERRDGPVVVGYGASAKPSVAAAVAALRADGVPRVAVAAYLLAPGHFHDLLATAGADVVTDPLCLPGAPDPRVVDVVLDRYDSAVTASSRPAPAR